MQCPFCKHYFDEELALDVQDKINWLLWQESMRQVKTKLRFWQKPWLLHRVLGAIRLHLRFLAESSWVGYTKGKSATRLVSPVGRRKQVNAIKKL